MLFVSPMSRTLDRQLYIDGISSIILSDGMIRFEMVQMDMHGDTSDPTLVPVQQVVMSPNAFIRMFAGFQDFTERLNEAGLLDHTRSSSEDSN